MTTRILDAGSFRLLAAVREPVDWTGPLVVYIEGDGAAYETPRRVAPDPTPTEPLALRLAGRDPAPAVAWLARPCQYRTRTGQSDCAPRWWSTHRFSEPAVAAVDAALDALAGSPPRRLGLVGYSGGGVLAAVVAARRNDVDWLVTVAAPVDLGGWLAHHHLSPLPQALDPMMVRGALARLPQVHLAGERDTIVPPGIADRLVDALPAPHRATTRVVAGADHRHGWVDAWPAARPRFD